MTIRDWIKKFRIHYSFKLALKLTLLLAIIFSLSLINFVGFDNFKSGGVIMGIVVVIKTLQVCFFSFILSYIFINLILDKIVDDAKWFRVKENDYMMNKLNRGIIDELTYSQYRSLRIK